VVKNGKGLGLVNMAERVHLVNGTIHIDSKPNLGTRVNVRVPIVTQFRSAVSRLQ
jgi:signal transduction histidine kinase